MFIKKNKTVVSTMCIAIVAALTGCATQERPTLSLSAKQAMTKARLVMVKDHPELEAKIQGSNATQAMGGGLLFLMADIAAMSEQKYQQSKLIEPIQKELTNQNILGTLKSEISNSIDQSSKFQFLGEEIEEDELENYISSHTSEVDSIGVLTPKYEFSEDFSTLNTSLAIKFIPTSTSFKTALGVSEAYNRSVIDTAVVYSVTPSETAEAKPNSEAIKNQAKQNIVGDTHLIDQTSREKIKRETIRLRQIAKEKNTEVWAKNKGSEINNAINSSFKILVQKLKSTLPIMFPTKVSSMEGTSKQSTN